MNVSRRQFGSTIAGFFGGLFFFKGLSASAVSSAAEISNGEIAKPPLHSQYVMRGTVDSDPKLKHYLKADGSNGCRMFFRLKSGATEPTSCVVWGKLASDLHHKMQIRQGMPLLVSGTPMVEKDPNGNDWAHVVLNHVVLDRVELDT